jgi:hypothetical protein
MPQPDNRKPIPGFQNPKCYAKGVGDCCRKLSAEHWVSKSIIELIDEGRGRKSKVVSVTRSKPQELGVPRILGIGNLTGKVLCVAHNEMLSPLDSAGKKMFEAMEDIHYGCKTPNKREKVGRIDGDQLERFLLKVICGTLFSGNLGLADGSMKGNALRSDWLKILVEGTGLPPGHGLYYLPVGSDEIIHADKNVLTFTLLLSAEPREPCGIRAWFFGIEFVLLLAELPKGVRTPFERALYRPAGLRVDGSNARIEFTWKDGSVGDEILLKLIWLA